MLRLDPSTGEAELRIGAADGAAGAGGVGFNKPTDVAVDPQGSGEVYVTDGYGNARVAVFTYEGKYLREWGSAAFPEPSLNLP